MAGSEQCLDLQGISSDASLTTSDHKPVYARYRLAIPRPLAELDAERNAHNLTATQFPKGGGGPHTVPADDEGDRNAVAMELSGVTMVIVRVSNLRCQGISRKGCASHSVDPKEIQKCQPVVIFKGAGELADRVPAQVLSKVARQGTAQFEGQVVIPLDGASTPGVID